jgi:DNA-binding CsgD family transcriptional regulator
LAQGRADEALIVTDDSFSEYPSRAMYAEYLSTRALALAVIGDRSIAAETAGEATELSACLDVAVLSAVVNAIVTREGTSAARASVECLLERASALAVWDPVVCAVRASSSLLARLCSVPEYRPQLRDVMLRSNDLALAKSAGLVTRSTGSHGVLTAREHEIMDHLRQGRKNAEIAASLYISAGTVKSHLDHIFDKLGVRSRAGAVARYAEIESGTDDLAD